jgi:lipopolysaccharide transport system ATP-binding protein
MALALSVEHVSKIYELGSIGSGTVAEDLNRLWARLRGRTDLLQPVGEEHPRQVGKKFWALDDVSFQVEPGQVLGVIGRNGAGKSTLLKILSQITAPSSGAIEIRGRVASLLEVGTGFHPDLTGRENVYLNGAILGMTTAEINRNFDEIVAFSECEAFIDTPVKRYSSGMYVRLAFAVAAHLQSEILIVDEVLAVGDTRFQKKCLGKMHDVSTDGRTILFVSHSMSSVSALCSHAMLLDGGRVQAFGRASEVVAEYRNHRAGRDLSSFDLTDAPRTGTGKAKFTGLEVFALDADGAALPGPVPGANLQIAVHLVAERRVESANAALIVYDPSGHRIIDVNTALKGEFVSLQPGERATVRFFIQDLLLKPGVYDVGVWLGRGQVEAIDHVENAGILDVKEQFGNPQVVETFPGVYQVRFSHDLAVHTAQ